MGNGGPVRQTLGFLLNDTSRLVRRRFVQRAREDGLPLSRSEAAVLLHVAHAQGTQVLGISQATLAAQLDIEPIALVRLLDSLQDAGLVARRAHPTDRRVRTVWLTDTAEPMLVRIRAVATAVREEATAGLTPAQVEALTGLLLAVRANLAAVSEPA